MESITVEALSGSQSELTNTEPTIPSYRYEEGTPTDSNTEETVDTSLTQETNTGSSIPSSRSEVATTESNTAQTLPESTTMPSSRPEIPNTEPNAELQASPGSPPEDATSDPNTFEPVEELVRGRVKSKTNWCKYCKTMQTKIIRHLINRHREMPEIQRYLQIESADRAKQKKKRREMCNVIINKANQVYNEKVTDEGGKERPIAVKRGKEKDISSLSHVQCSTCGGLVTRKYFGGHRRTCEERQRSGLLEAVAAPKSVLLRPTLAGKYKSLEKHIFVKMVKDEVSLTAQTDPLILEFGRRFFQCHRATNQRNYVSTKIRTLADLLVRLRRADPTNVKTMSDCVDPANFDTLSAVVRRWSAYNEENGVCDKGSVPRRLCKSLKTCSHVLLSEAVKNKELTRREKKEIQTKHEQFMSLMVSDWSLEVNSAADKSIKIRRIAKEDIMPLEDDIKTYFRHMTRMVESGNAKLKTKHDLDSYTALTKACIAYLVAFNCRRPTEVTYATVDNLSTLVENENRLSVFTVAATKNNVKVPVIVPIPVKEAINTLVEHRSRLNVKGELLFGKEDGTAYNGGNVISKFKSEMNLLKPDYLTANGFRHYLATVSQLDPRVKKHMPKFLGHTLFTHERFYEMPMSDIHLGVIGPVLSEHCLPANRQRDPSVRPTFEEHAGGNTSNESLVETFLPGYSDEESQPARTSLAASIRPLASSCSDEENEEEEEEGAAAHVVDPYKDPTPSTSFGESVSCGSTFLRRPPPGENSDSDEYETRPAAEEPQRKRTQPTVESDEDRLPGPARKSAAARLRPRSINTSAGQQPSSEERSDPDDVSWQVPQDYHTLGRRRPDQSDSSELESAEGSSPLRVGKRNKWLTPERQELYAGLPRTMLGLEHAGRGRIKTVWHKSRFLKLRHSLQTTRIEVSKYYTGKKKIPTPVRTKILETLGENVVDSG